MVIGVMILIGLLLVVLPVTAAVVFLLAFPHGPSGAPGAFTGAGRTRDRLMGRWEMPIPQLPGKMLQMDFRQDGSLIVSDSGNTLPPITSSYEVTREGTDSIQLRVRSHNDPNDAVQWDIQFVGADRIQLTSSAPDTPVRTYTRAR
jgi:hypothetical protein